MDDACQVRAVFGKDPRQYSVMTTKFLADDDGNVRGLVTVDVEVGKDGIKVNIICPLIVYHLSSLCACDVLVYDGGSGGDIGVQPSWIAGAV